MVLEEVALKSRSVGSSGTPAAAASPPRSFGLRDARGSRRWEADVPFWPENMRKAYRLKDLIDIAGAFGPNEGKAANHGPGECRLKFGVEADEARASRDHVVNERDSSSGHEEGLQLKGRRSVVLWRAGPLGPALAARCTGLVR